MKKIKRMVAFCLVATLVFLSASDVLVKADEGTWNTVTNDNTVVDSIYEFTGDAYLANKGDKMLLLDENFNVLATYDSIECLYSYIESDTTIYFKVINDDKTFVVDSNNQVIIPESYDDVSYRGDNLFEVKQNDKWGIVNNKNELLVPIEYDDFPYSENSEYLVAIKDNNYGVINTNNEIIIPFEYQKIYLSEYTNDYFLAEKNEKYGLISTNSVIINFEYEEVAEVEEGILQCEQPKYVTFYHSDGTKIEFPGYEILNKEMDGYFKIFHCNLSENKTYYGYIKEGMTAPIFTGESLNEIQYMGGGYFLVTNASGEKEVVDESKTVILPYQSNYKDIKYVGNGYFTIWDTNNKSGLINNKGEIILQPVVTGLHSDDGITFKGYISLDDELKTSIEIVIDLSLMKNLPSEYDYAYLSGQDGYCIIAKDDKYALANSSLNLITGFEYDKIIYIGDNYYKVLKDGKYGIIDSNNNVIKPCTYDYIYIYNPNHMEASDYSQHGFTDNTIIMYKGTATSTPPAQNPTSVTQVGKSYVFDDIGTQSNDMKTIKTTIGDLNGLSSNQNVAFDFNSVAFKFPVNIFNNLSTNGSDEIKLDIKETSSDKLKTENKPMFTLAQTNNINPLKSFDINLNIGGNVIHQLGDYVEIVIDLSTVSLNGADPNTLEIYYYNTETNKLEAMQATYNATTNTITFKTNHFSTYLLGSKQSATATSIPTTADNNTYIFFYLTILISSLIVLLAFAIKDRKKYQSNL